MGVQILEGDARRILKCLPSESVDCIVTSPPYWGLRDYGYEGQIGLENSIEDHLNELTGVFSECRRVLKSQGVFWLNYGDAYASTRNGRSAAKAKHLGEDDRAFRDKPMSTIGGLFKPKDRMLLPARLAIQLHADGWYLRDEIVWHKPNPMPISVRDRTTPSHEMLYMFSKSKTYFYDQDAIKEPIADSSRKRYAQPAISNQKGGSKSDAYESGYIGHSSRSRRPNEIIQQLARDGQETRNRRSVWTIPTRPFPGAHFATFTPALIEPCILAGCPLGGTVLDPFFGCGTTGEVAQKLKRSVIGIEMSSEYATLARKRLGVEEDIFS